ncbi:TPA: hypothetical protein N0F65_003544 [Lagenidium giganteum]|uniref:LicD/FKTN/FKRP nucleotidyltransferase domain-containing protein n=1 Tax=Lagenidium giganteum TaxID=4803 RepID=A0AAV2YXG5_9STRA|nr:TPA: hypothetical protein N0F65_003544 [Lagenidium giganteum]
MARPGPGRGAWVAAIVLFELWAIWFFLMNAPPTEVLHDDMREQTSPNIRRCLSTDDRELKYVKAGQCVTITDRIKAIEEVVAQTTALLERLQVVYWLDSGTLLGQYRDKRTIPRDSDGDVGVLVEGFERLRTTPVRLAEGYELLVRNSSIHDGRGRFDGLPARVVETTFGFYVDIFVFLESTNDDAEATPMLGPLPSECWVGCANCPTTGHIKKHFVIPRSWVLPVKPCILNEFEVSCPARPVPYLSHLYGDSFLVPTAW